MSTGTGIVSLTCTLQVEVGPSDFVKVKMLGKGDVGRVYLVREKKSSKLYAMKGKCRDGVGCVENGLISA